MPETNPPVGVRESQQPIVAKNTAAFNRGRHCTRFSGEFKCVHYIDCQDDRYYNNRKASSRYSTSAGDCYVPSQDEIRTTMP